MKKTVIFPICFLIAICHAQEKPRNFFNDPYRTFSGLEEDVHSMDGQIAAAEATMVGEYALAKKYYEGTRKRTFPKVDFDPADHIAHEALAFLDSLIGEHRAVFINEAHHISQHHNFVRQILPLLKHKGFRYLGMEALNPTDTLFCTRGYPVKNTGFYTKDPEYAELLRDALALGFNLFGYDDGAPTPKEREIKQARNIIRKLPHNDSAKVLILAGFDHINEADTLRRWGRAMAGRFRQYTGLDPLTLDQVQFTPRHNKGNDNPIHALFKVSTPTIITGRDFPFRNPYQPDRHYDYHVFHPTERLKGGVPEWKYSFERSPLPTAAYLPGNAMECLILAYDHEEYLLENHSTKRLVPRDIVSVRQGHTPRPLMLAPGRYILEITGPDGITLSQKEVQHEK